MRRIAAAFLALFALTGFGPPPYDPGLLPKAQSGRAAAVTACRNRTDIQRLSDVMACVVSADSVFAEVIGFRDRGVFENFSAQVAELKAESDAGKVAAPDAAKRFSALEDDFFLAIRTAYNDYESEEAQQYARDSADAAERDRRSMQRMDSMNGMNGMNGMMGN